MTQKNQSNIVYVGVDFSTERTMHRFDILGTRGHRVGTLEIGLPAAKLEDLSRQVLQAHAAVADVLRDLTGIIEDRAAALAETLEA